MFLSGIRLWIWLCMGSVKELQACDWKKIAEQNSTYISLQVSESPLGIVTF